MSATGIHEHDSFKLGLKPPDPSKPSLKLSSYLTGVIPAHPASVDWIQNVQYGLYQNDTWGDCGPTAVANSRRLVTRWLTGTMQAPSQDEVFDLYRRSGNPNFDPSLSTDDPRQQDNGVNMQLMLQAVVSGGIGGVKGLGFAKVDTRNEEELKAAVAIFGFLLFGVNLENAQKTQTNSGVWDYNWSLAWGGHAILGAAYEANGIDVVTWAQRVRMTDRFVQKQLDEAWVLIWPEHLRDKTFLEGVDMQALAKDFSAITGRPFPVKIPTVADLERSDFVLV